MKAGEHQFRDELGNAIGSFVVYRVGTQWYWQEKKEVGHERKANPFGPYASAEAAYQAAVGED